MGRQRNRKNREKTRVPEKVKMSKKFKLDNGQNEKKELKHSNHVELPSSQHSEELLKVNWYDEDPKEMDTVQTQCCANETSTNAHKKDQIMDVDPTPSSTDKKKCDRFKNSPNTNDKPELQKNPQKPSDKTHFDNKTNSSEGWTTKGPKKNKKKGKSTNHYADYVRDMDWQSEPNTQSSNENHSSKDNRDEHRSKQNQDNSSNRGKNLQNVDRDSSARRPNSRRHGQGNSDQRDNYRSNNQNSGYYQKQNDNGKYNIRQRQFNGMGYHDEKNADRNKKSQQNQRNGTSSLNVNVPGKAPFNKNNHQANNQHINKKNKQPLFVPNAEHYEPTIKEVEGDLFHCSKEYSLVHCVAEDFLMGAGIAIEFKAQFKGVQELLDQGKKTGEVAILNRNNRFIFYLVTKVRSRGKPTIASLTKSIQSLKQICVERNVKKLAMPRIGCGLDRLNWDEVKDILYDEFSNTDIEIVVYVL